MIHNFHIIHMVYHKRWCGVGVFGPRLTRLCDRHMYTNLAATRVLAPDSRACVTDTCTRIGRYTCGRVLAHHAQLHSVFDPRHVEICRPNTPTCMDLSGLVHTCRPTPAWSGPTHPLPHPWHASYISVKYRTMKISMQIPKQCTTMIKQIYTSPTSVIMV